MVAGLWECLLKNSHDAPGLEFSLALPQIQCHADMTLVFSGAPLRIRCRGQTVPMLEVIHARAGDVFHLQQGMTGLRSYVTATGGLKKVDAGYAAEACDMSCVGRRRATWGTVNDWAPPRGWLRLLPGPEWHPDLGARIQGPWRVDARSDHMGLRLQGPRLQLESYDLWSSPVADGTVQLSQQGPMILLRGRQTIGGYPRIANLIDADIDLAGQLRPGSAIRFMVVDEETAASARQQKQAYLMTLSQA